MENLAKRTILILAVAFLIANVGWFVSLLEMNRRPVANCTYHGPSMTCTPSDED
jgi:hypothetical protein